MTPVWTRRRVAQALAALATATASARADEAEVEQLLRNLVGDGAEAGGPIHLELPETAPNGFLRTPGGARREPDDRGRSRQGRAYPSR